MLQKVTITEGQRELEIKCKVIETPRQVTERYSALVEELCAEPKEEKTLVCSF